MFGHLRRYFLTGILALLPVGITAWVLLLALAAHIGGAMKHHLIDKDTTLLRMIGKA